jgi:ElaB/YqjD/DUF883 family membrane-anchored ribosome-binding protein
MAQTTGFEYGKPFGAPEKEHEGLIGSLAEKAKGVAETVGEYAGEAKDTVQNMASGAVAGVAHAKDAVQEWATDAAENVGEAAKTAGHEMTELIRRHPYPALLVGFGVGFLLARVIKSL